MSDRTGRFAIAVACGAFLALSLPHLDRLPPIHNDEPTILAPGLKLFTHGVFGLDMLDGLAGADRHYLEVMPAMSVLEGAVARLAGTGVWQMRVVPVALGVATMALAGVLALRLAGPTTAALTVGLLLLWKWTPGRGEFLPSGIPLVDVSRIARYDILAAPLGLAALLAFFSARARGSPSLCLLAGGCVGAATLATPYAAFWGAALLILLPLDVRWSPAAARHGWRDAGLVAGAATAFVLPWVLFALLHWGELQGQFARHAGRFALASPAFYAGSLLHEIERYELGLRSPATFTRIGFWLLVVGVPAALVWLARHANATRDRHALWLLIPCVAQPALLALLVNVKRFYYLISVVPLFAVVLAWGFTALLGAPRRVVRVAAAAVLVLAAAEGAVAIVRMHEAAARCSPPAGFLVRLRGAVGPAAQRILGPHPYWFAVPGRDYLSFTVPVSIMAAEHGSLGDALTTAAPDTVLLTPYLIDVYTHLRFGPGPATVGELHTLLGTLGFVETGELTDNTGKQVEVWQARVPIRAPAEAHHSTQP